MPSAVLLEAAGSLLLRGDCAVSLWGSPLTVQTSGPPHPEMLPAPPCAAEGLWERSDLVMLDVGKTSTAGLPGATDTFYNWIVVTAAQLGSI